MSLNFDVSKIEGYNDKYGQDPYDKEWHPVTSVIVHRMMHTGLGWELTESNAAEFYARCKLCDKLSGEILYKEGTTELTEITPEMIHDHIGLTCNVGEETRQEFLKRWVGHDMDRWIRTFNYALDKPAEVC